MSKWFKISVVGLLVVGAVAALFSGIALAQSDTPQTPETALPHAWGRGFGRGPGSQVGLEATAEALGMTVDELTTQLWGGKTVADLAEEKGVDLTELRATVEAEVQAARETALRAAIEQALQDEEITQEHADWLLEGLDKGFLMRGFGRGLHPGFGPGFGQGFGKRGGWNGRGF